MCQLVACHLGRKDWNLRGIATLLYVASSVGHKHGTGAFMLNDSGKAVHWKTAISADALINLGTVIGSNFSEKKGISAKSTQPIFGHVRDASKGISVVDANAHPFEGERFVLAHNGRLWEESVGRVVGAEEESDSLKFLLALEAKAALTPEATILELCNSAMQAFTGKFAFLFLDKKTGKRYVARGSSANLHLVSFFSHYQSGKDEKGEEIIEMAEPLGTIIATEKNTAHLASGLICAQLQLDGIPKAVAGEPEELKKNTLYEITDSPIEIVEVGEVKERAVDWGTGYDGFPVSRGNYNAGTTYRTDLSVPIWKKMTRVTEFLDSHHLSLADFDLLLWNTVGQPLLGLTEENLDIFLNNIVPRISAGKKLRKKLKQIIPDQVVPRWVYKEVSTKLKIPVQFPWMLNSKEVIDEMLKCLKATKDK